MTVTQLFILIAAVGLLMTLQYAKESALAGIILLLLYVLQEIFKVHRARSGRREKDKEVAVCGPLYDYIMVLIMLHYIYILISREW